MVYETSCRLSNSLSHKHPKLNKEFVCSLWLRKSSATYWGRTHAKICSEFLCGKTINIGAKYPSSLYTLYVHRVWLILGSNVSQRF